MTVSASQLENYPGKNCQTTFILEEQPLQNIDQPLLAAALREILEIAGLILEETLVAALIWGFVPP